LCCASIEYVKWPSTLAGPSDLTGDYDMEKILVDVTEELESVKMRAVKVCIKLRLAERQASKIPVFV
jgi:hypothetical protein